MSKSSFTKRLSRAVARQPESPIRSARITAAPYTPPTDEQLVNFACAMTHGPGATEFERFMVAQVLKSNPMVRSLWMEKHRTLQSGCALEFGK